MAIFRRKRDAKDDNAPAASEENPVAEDSSLPGQVPAHTDDGGAAPVGISLSAYSGFGAPSAAAAPAASAPSAPATSATPGAPGQPGTPGQRTTKLGPETAPTASETIPGLRDNALLRDALAALPEKPGPAEVAGAARNLMQGHLFLRVKGDARALLSEGKDLPLAVMKKDDLQYVLAYSSGAALSASVRADGDTDTSAMGQPAVTVIRYVLNGEYDGIIVDPASAPARAVYPRALLERMLTEGDPELELKGLLSAERTDETAAKVVDALTRVKIWLAANTSADGRMGIAEVRTPEGERFLEVYSHPLEVLAVGRSDRPALITGAQLGAALRADEGISGVIVDVAGPWIRIPRAQLGPVLALD